MALHPAGHAEEHAGAPARRAGHGAHGRGRSGVPPGPAPARRRHRGGRPARPSGPALLRRQGPHPHVRSPLHRLAVHERARLDELRQRPRGRQRAVRAELPVRRRADHRRPGHLLPLHGPHAGPRGRHGSDVHAQAVHPPHRQRPAHEHVALVDRGAQPVPGRSGQGSLRPRALPPRIPVRGGCPRPRPQLVGHRLPDGQQLQAHGGRPAQFRSDVGPGVRGLRRQQPHAADAGARRRADRVAGGRRLGQPVPRLRRGPGRRTGRHRSQARSRPAEQRQPLRGRP